MQLIEKRCLLSRAELLEPLEGLAQEGLLRDADIITIYL